MYTPAGNKKNKNKNSNAYAQVSGLLWAGRGLLQARRAATETPSAIPVGEIEAAGCI